MKRMDIASYMIGYYNLTELHSQKTTFIYKLISQYHHWKSKPDSDWDNENPLYLFKSKDLILSDYLDVIQIEIEKFVQFTEWLIRCYPSNKYTQWFKISADEFERTLELLRAGVE